MSTKTRGFGDPKRDVKDKGKPAIERLFSPEFRNRLDAIITFILSRMKVEEANEKLRAAV